VTGDDSRNNWLDRPAAKAVPVSSPPERATDGPAPASYTEP
jgi:hypothetical protein